MTATQEGLITEALGYFSAVTTSVKTKAHEVGRGIVIHIVPQTIGAYDDEAGTPADVELRDPGSCDTPTVAKDASPRERVIAREPLTRSSSIQPCRSSTPPASSNS